MSLTLLRRAVGCFSWPRDTAAPAKLGMWRCSQCAFWLLSPFFSFFSKDRSLLLPL